MSNKIININERRKGENEVPDVELSLPSKVLNANWHDDVVDEAEDETKEATSFETFENEQDYKSKENISREAGNEIIAFQRNIAKRFGEKIKNVYDADEYEERAA